MATREVLDKLIGSTPNIDYASLPPRVKAAVSFDEWRRHVIDHCIAHGLPWESPARTVCDERQYYESLLAVFRSEKRLYPYHLGEYVCRVLRVTPFAYYCDVLVDTMKEDSAYDVIPNFTAADIASTVGIGRNEYIAIMQQAKSKMLWRVNKGLVRDLLPELPQNVRPRQPWWRVCLVNLGEVEYRTMSSVGCWYSRRRRRDLSIYLSLPHTLTHRYPLFAAIPGRGRGVQVGGESRRRRPV